VPRVPEGFTSDDLTIDFDARTVTCPANHTVVVQPSDGAGFETHCRANPLAHRCTTAKRGTKLTLSAYEHSMRAARGEARDPQWRAEYRQHRPMVERSIAG
jgi:Transposase DDE domain